MRQTFLKVISIAVMSVTVHGSAAAQTATPGMVARVPVSWLIFVDDLHLEFRNTGRIRDVLKTMAKELIQDGDRFAIASSGPSNLAVAMTSDAQVLAAAFKFATGNALKPEDIYQSANGSAEVLYRASTAVSAAQAMFTDLPSTGRGPTVMLYVSNGYMFDVLPDPAPDAPRLGGGRDVTRAEVQAQLRELTATATRMMIPIVAIDRRLAPLDRADLLSTAHSTEMQRSLRAIAEATGGFAIADGDLVTQLKRVANRLQR